MPADRRRRYRTDSLSDGNRKSDSVAEPDLFARCYSDSDDISDSGADFQSQPLTHGRAGHTESESEPDGNGRAHLWQRSGRGWRAMRRCRKERHRSVLLCRGLHLQADRSDQL